MADVASRLTGRPGACLSTLGPGATNMTTGVGNAFLDRVPVVAITGRMGRKWRNRTVQMQVDHRALFAPITKWGAEIDPGSAAETMRRAFEVAQAEQPGPVHLDLPEDVAEEPSAEPVPTGLGAPAAPLPPPDCARAGRHGPGAWPGATAAAGRGPHRKPCRSHRPHPPCRREASTAGRLHADGQGTRARIGTAVCRRRRAGAARPGRALLPAGRPRDRRRVRPGGVQLRGLGAEGRADRPHRHGPCRSPPHHTTWPRTSSATSPPRSSTSRNSRRCATSGTLRPCLGIARICGRP